MEEKRTLDFSSAPVHNQDRSESDAKSDLSLVKMVIYKEISILHFGRGMDAYSLLPK